MMCLFGVYFPPPGLVGWRKREQIEEINLVQVNAIRFEALSSLKVVTEPLDVSLTLITGGIVSFGTMC